MRIGIGGPPPISSNRKSLNTVIMVTVWGDE
jgi:hypothetical protein